MQYEWVKRKEQSTLECPEDPDFNLMVYLANQIHNPIEQSDEPTIENSTGIL